MVNTTTAILLSLAPVASPVVQIPKRGVLLGDVVALTASALDLPYVITPAMAETMQQEACGLAGLRLTVGEALTALRELGEAILWPSGEILVCSPAAESPSIVAVEARNLAADGDVRQVGISVAKTLASGGFSSISAAPAAHAVDLLFHENERHPAAEIGPPDRGGADIADDVAEAAWLCRHKSAGAGRGRSSAGDRGRNESAGVG